MERKRTEQLRGTFLRAQTTCLDLISVHNLKSFFISHLKKKFNNNNSSNMNNMNNNNGWQQRTVVPITTVRRLGLPPAWAVLGGYSCAICYKEIDEHKSKIGQLPCEHVFCHKCIQKWFDTGSANRQLCPYCLTPFEVSQVDTIEID